jgi:putative ABC transport system substrate-binding protein
MNNRRKLIVALGAGALAAPLSTFAQPLSTKVYRIGFLGAVSASSFTDRTDAVRAGLRDLGYIDGKNIVIEYRWAEGHFNRLAELAAELVRAKVDVLLTHATPGTLAAKAATTTIPIVMTTVGDPVANGIVNSLAHPDGNITGTSYFYPQLIVKQLELLKEASPRIKRIGVLFPPDNILSKPSLQALAGAASLLNLTLDRFTVRASSEIDGAITAMVKARVDAIVVFEDPILNIKRQMIVDRAVNMRIASAGSKEFGEAGGLIGYGPDYLAMYRRAAYFVDRIFRGAKPSELPVEQATKFDLIVNSKTAKAIGINIPNSILVRAEKMIE